MTWVITLILDWLFNKLVELGLVAAKQAARDSSADKTAQEDANKLKEAKDDKDREDAARSINDHTW